MSVPHTGRKAEEDCLPSFKLRDRHEQKLTGVRLQVEYSETLPQLVFPRGREPGFSHWDNQQRDHMIGENTEIQNKTTKLMHLNFRYINTTHVH